MFFLPFTSSSWWVHVGVISLICTDGDKLERRPIREVVVFAVGMVGVSRREDPSWQHKANWVVLRSKYMITYLTSVLSLIASLLLSSFLLWC
jgi:hypothetical protein